ncbi:MAG: pyruvate ferredoxin oxidoreductase gamma subunit [Thermotogota bacterium]|nr:pyruvate ferredoxin oxidoreductase gamma subunit [Thermotogota bacterium]MDK2864667.1 pyruvate ferredoxin oxidoreductase gamma subunit [Thermotogota bacterium]
MQTTASKLLEIRWHGRAGQGAKSAAQILAEAALASGMFVQAFPEYGAERSGAPMRAFNKISSSYIRSHAPVLNPDVVVVLDDTLLGAIPVTDGMKEDSVLIVNTTRGVEWVRKRTGFSGKICIVKATDIALEEIGRGMPNTPMLGALVKVTDVVPLETVEKNIRETLGGKLSEKALEGNIRALRRGFEEVTCSG